LNCTTTSKCRCITAGCHAKVAPIFPRRYTPLTSCLGLSGDPIGRLIKKTAFNPAFTLGLLLLARYTKKGSDFSILHETAFKRVKTLFYLGLARWASGFFDDGVLNNWTKDTYEWDKEIVLITGGAGGIGGSVVKLLAERGIKVVVLDVIPVTFETRKSALIPIPIPIPELLVAIC
jgi:all-trans-retinol dehydrogenase (NAD+)